MSVKSLSKLMDKMGLTEISVQENILWGLVRTNIHLSKNPDGGGCCGGHAPGKVAPVAASATKTAPTQPDDAENTIKSPMVGVAYLSPEPGAKPFANVGDLVKAGDTIILIEAMKTFNPVKVDRDGILKKILITDGATVEYGQPLAIIE